MLITIEIFTHLTYKLLMKNLLKDLEPAGEQTTLFSQAGSRNYANHTHRLVSDLEKKMTATSGQRCVEQYERFSRPTLWARMFSDLLIGMEGWYSTKCRLTWKLRGTKYNRLYFQLVPSTLPTEGIGFGLLPTVTTQETPHLQAELTENNRRKALNGNSHSLNIADLALRKMLPTPNARDYLGETTPGKRVTATGKIQNYGEVLPDAIKRLTTMPGMLPAQTAMDSTNATATMKSTEVKEGSMHSVTLVRYMMNNPLLNTPCASDKNGGCTRPNEKLQLGTNLVNEMHGVLDQQPGKTSQLNPPFVLEMMGFPPGWTELPFLNGETKA